MRPGGKRRSAASDRTRKAIQKGDVLAEKAWIQEVKLAPQIVETVFDRRAAQRDAEFPL